MDSTNIVRVSLADSAAAAAALAKVKGDKAKTQSVTARINSAKIKAACVRIGQSEMAKSGTADAVAFIAVKATVVGSAKLAKPGKGEVIPDLGAFSQKALIGMAKQLRETIQRLATMADDLDVIGNDTGSVLLKDAVHPAVAVGTVFNLRGMKGMIGSQLIADAVLKDNEYADSPESATPRSSPPADAPANA